jgi:hypothetical protein
VEITAAATRPAASADDALVERARQGDATAFDTLVATRLDRCYRLAWSILLNDADAADATQDAFVAAWRQLPRLRDARAFDGWLNRIVANAARMAGASDPAERGRRWSPDPGRTRRSRVPAPGTTSSSKRSRLTPSSG